jgi:CO dehydrogenase/acetyl-CoA synthase beta subunit
MEDKLNELLEYIYEEFDLEPILDRVDINIIEQEIVSINDALNDKELKDSWNSMKESLNEFEKYKDKEYSCMFCVSYIPIINHVCVIFDKNFNYINRIEI